MEASNRTMRNLGTALLCAAGATVAVLLIGSQLGGDDTTGADQTLPGSVTTVAGSDTTSPLGVDPTATDPATTGVGGVTLPQGGTAVPQTTAKPGASDPSNTTTPSGGPGPTLPADTTSPKATAPPDTVPMPVKVAGPSNVVEQRPPYRQPDGGILITWLVRGSDTAKAYSEVRAQLLASGWVELLSTVDEGDFRTETKAAKVLTFIEDDGNTTVMLVVYE